MRAALCILALVSLPASVAAQDMSWSTITPAITGTDTLGLVLRQQMQQRSRPAVPMTAMVGPGRNISAGPQTARLSYPPSLARRRANLAQFVEKSRAADPAGAAKMAQLFASTDVIGMIDKRMRTTYGMRADNVADAYAVWWTGAWIGAQGRSDDPTPGQMAIVRRQAANAIGSVPEFAGATDATKQQFAEALLVQAALIGESVDRYKSDPAMLAKVKAAIKQGARRSRVDLDAMRLTENGFVAR